MSPADARVHRRIDEEHEASSAAFKRNGGMTVSLLCCPAIRDLLETVDAAASCGYRFSSGFFKYRGRRYPVQCTSFGRVIVKHPDTGDSIGATAFFSSW